MTYHDVVMLLAAVWCIVWWLYAAYWLLIPLPGESMFHPKETPEGKLLMIVMWSTLIVTAPFWCPIQAYLHDDNDHSW